MLPLYTRWLSVGEYGSIDMIQVYVNLLLGMATACIADAVFLFAKGQSHEKQQEYFFSGLCLGLFMLVATFFLFKAIDGIFDFLQTSNSFTNNKWTIYAIMVVTFLQGYAQQFIRSINKLKIYCVTSIVLTGSILFFSILMIPKHGVSGYVTALIISNVIAFVCSFFSAGLYKYMRIGAFKVTICKEMLKFSLPLVPNSAMLWLVGSLNRPVMEKYLGIYAIGIFAAAHKFNGIITAFFQIFSKSWEISVLEEFKKGNYGYFYNKIFRMLVFGIIFLFFIIVLFNQNIIHILVASEFYEASKYVPLLVLGAIFFNFSVFIGANFLPVHKSKYYLYTSVFGAIVSLAGNSVLIPRYGITGAALSVSLSYFLMLIMRLFYSRKIVRIEHGLFYVITIFMIIGAVVAQMIIEINWLRSSVLTILFVVFLTMNHSIINYFLKLPKILSQRHYT
jgi:O-antigen/teichoic acid export membrane protein